MAKQKKSSITIEQKEVDLSEVLQNEENPRFIRDEKYNQLKQSIEEFPEMLNLRELVVDENMILLGGNMRHRVLTELGTEKVSIKQIHGLTEHQKKEFIIKDNVSYGQWDWDILANEWDSIALEEWGLETYGTENIDLDQFFEPDTTEQKPETNKIILEYTDNDFEIIKTELDSREGTKENIIWKLLGL